MRHGILTLSLSIILTGAACAPAQSTGSSSSPPPQPAPKKVLTLATQLEPPIVYVTNIVYAIFFLNLSTFAFQLLPIPGLDGWRVVEAIFRDRNPRFFFNVASRTQMIWWIAVLIVFFGPYLVHFDILGAVVGIFFQPASSAILGQCAGYTTLNPCPLSARF